MDEALQEAAAWAQTEFGAAELGDVRRSKRLVQVAQRLAERPGGTLHGSVPDYAELMAAYRLLDQEEVTFEAVTAPHHARVVAACREPGSYLVFEDTTQLDFTSHPHTEGLGRIGDDDGLGLLLHSTLAARVEGWNKDGRPRFTLVGFVHQKCWARTLPTIGCHEEKKRRRLGRPRESERWGEGYASLDPLPPGVQWTHVGDRESDIYEVFERCESRGVGWIIRASQERALADEGRSVFEAVAAAPRRGRFDLKLRARPEQAARRAYLEVRACTVTLRAPWRPGQRRPPFTLNVVEVREARAPRGVEPLRWVLLTSWPVSTFRESLRVVRTYACRPVIEEYHRALKSGGTQAERSQLMTAARLEALMGVLSLVALRLVGLKTVAAADPQARLPAGQIAPEALTLLQRAQGKPRAGWTCAAVLIAIAKLGGFLARKCDGPPGWRSIWRGWERLMIMVEGVRLLHGGRARAP